MTTASGSGSGALQLALLGCGHLGQDVYIPLLRHRPDARVAVIADASAEARARASALTRNRIPVVSDWREALTRADIDGAIIALPSALHAAAAIAAFQRRLHVYVEKPLATNAPDAAGVVGAHREAGTVATVGFNYRFNPLYSELRDRVTSGKVGRVRFIRTMFSSPQRSIVGWRESRDAGGGVLLELGSHHADLIRWVSGAEATSVQCLMSGPDTAGSCASVTLSLDNGAAAQMLIAFGTIAEDRVEVIGDRGAISVNRYRSLMPDLRGTDVPGRFDALKRVWQGVPRLAYLVTKMTSPWHEPSHRLALDRFVSAARGAGTTGVPLQDGVESLRIVLAAEESATSGHTVILR